MNELERGPSGVPAVEKEGALLVWQVFGAPGLTVALLGAMLALLFVATQVPQGVPTEDISATHSFSVSLFIDGFGLSHVATSWPMMLLAVLLVLNLVGRWLRRRVGSLDVGSEGSLARVETAEVDAVDAVALAKRLEPWFGPSRVHVRSDRVEARRGLVREGLIAAAIGAAVLGAAGLLHISAGQSGRIVTRVSPPPGLEPRDVTQIEVDTGRSWDPGGPQLEVSCQPAPEGGADAWACAFAGEGVHTTVVLAPGQPAWLPGLRVTLERAEPMRALDLVHLGLTNPHTGEDVTLDAVPGRSYDVVVKGAEGDVDLSLRAVHGVEGPIALVATAGAASVLAGVGGAAGAGTSSGPVVVRGLTDQRLVMRFSTTEHRAVAVAGALLALLGLAMFALARHLSVTAREVAPGRWAVHASSLDRPERARELLRDLVGPSAGEEPR